MATTARLDLSVWRNDDVYEFRLLVRGPNLTGAAMRAQIRLAPDTPGAPLANLATVANGNAEGIRLAGAATVDGVWHNDVRIRLNKSTRQALPYSGELGSATPLAWAFQIDGRTRLTGEVLVLAHAIDSDSAPANRPAGFGARTGGLPTGSATLTIAADDGAVLTIDGADLIGPLAEQARLAAEQALAIAPQIVPQGDATVLSNTDAGTHYAIATPDAFEPITDGRYVDFIVPETSLGPITLTVDSVGPREVFMVRGQTFREGWSVRVQKNPQAPNWVLIRQVPQGVDLIAAQEIGAAARLGVEAIAGVPIAIPLDGNPNELFIDFDRWENDARFCALIVAENTGTTIINLASGQRRAVLDCPPGSLKRGQIAQFVVSFGVDNIYYRGARRDVATPPELWDALDATLAKPFGDVAQGGNGKPVLTPIALRAVGRGSSVSTDPTNMLYRPGSPHPEQGREGASPVGQAPVAVLAQMLSQQFGPGVVVNADNWSHGGDVAQQGELQWSEAMADDPSPVDVLLDCFGMNDMASSSYNAGQQSPIYLGNPLYYEGELKRRLEDGVKAVILCTSPHTHTGRLVNSFGGNNMVWPYAKPAPVALDELVPPYLVTPPRDWTGSGVLRAGDARGQHVNLLIRNVARRLQRNPLYTGRVFLLDAEWAWFRYGVEAYDLDQLFNPGEIVHPNTLGHEVSYWRCLREFVAAARRGFGDQWCFRGEAH